MAKILYTGPTPLDGAVADFLSRIVADGKQLNHVTAFTFNRQVGEGHTVTITFLADEELAQFGTPFPFGRSVATKLCTHTWSTVKGDDTAHHQCREVGTHTIHRCGGCAETDPESIPLVHDAAVCSEENFFIRVCECPCPDCRLNHVRD